MESNTDTNVKLENGKIFFATNKVDEMTVNEAQLQMQNIDKGIENLNNQKDNMTTNISNMEKEIVRLNGIKQSIISAGVEELVEEDGSNKTGNSGTPNGTEK